MAVASVMVWGVCLYLLSFVNAREPGEALVITRTEVARFTGLLLIIIASITSLSATYSRSGMVAVFVVACVLWRSRDARRWIVMSLIVLTLCLMIMPEAGERFTRFEPLTDASITHRFDVWRGTLAMSLERPWTGFGIGDFGNMLTKWHLPVNNLDTIYVTAVSTPLTILGFWGYPILFAYLWGWTLLLIVGFRGLWRENKAIAACFIIQLAFLVGGFFASLHQSRILNTVLLASICGTLVFHLKDSLAWKLFYRRWGIIAATASATMCGLLAASGLWIFSEGYELRDFPLDAHGESTGHGWILAPKKPCGRRLVWFAPNGKVKEHAQILCRPLASQGWEVFMLEAGVGELIKPEVAAVFLHGNTPIADKIDQCVVGGFGDDGLAALALASRLSQNENSRCETVVVNIESDWPFEAINPQNTIKTINGPLVLAYEASNTHNFTAAETLAGFGKSHGKQVALLPLEASDERAMLSALRTHYFENRCPSIKQVHSNQSNPQMASIYTDANNPKGFYLCPSVPSVDNTLVNLWGKIN